MASPLLALSQTSAFALYPLIVLCLALSIYAIFGGWSRSADRQQTRLWQLLVLPTAAFLTLWICSRTLWLLFLWLWAGDQYLHQVDWVAGMFALAYALVLYVRLARGWVNHRYLRINAWGIGLCMFLFGTFSFIEFADLIDGWTARGAAEKKFASLMEPSKFYPEHLPRRIVDETTPELAKVGGKSFRLYIDEKSAAELRVMPYYNWWWAVSYFRTTPFAGEDLSIKEQIERFRESLKE